MISIIVATANNGVIGKEDALPWHLPAELANFKKVTMGHPIIMGRKTHQSIGRALPGRTNIVVSRDPTYKAEGCEVSSSLEAAIKIASDSQGASEIFIIGGASIYELAVPIADKIYLTKVDADVEGDRFFKFNEAGWELLSAKKHATDEKNKYSYEFRQYVRRTGG